MSPRHRARTQHSIYPQHCVILAPAVSDSNRPDYQDQTDNDSDSRRRAIDTIRQDEQEKLGKVRELLIAYLNKNGSLVSENSACIPYSTDKHYTRGYVFAVNKFLEESLPDKVKELKKDIKFAHEISKYADLHVVSFDGAPTKDLKRKLKSKWSSYELVKTEMLKELKRESDQKKQARKKSASKCRGIQRPSSEIKKSAIRDLMQQNLPRHESVIFVEFVYPERNSLRNYNFLNHTSKGKCNKNAAQRINKSKANIGLRNSCDMLKDGSYFSYNSDQYSDELDSDEEWPENQSHESKSLITNPNDGFYEEEEASQKRSVVRNHAVNLLDFCKDEREGHVKKRKRSRNRSTSFDFCEDFEVANASTKKVKGFVVQCPSGYTSINVDRGKSEQDLCGFTLIDSEDKLKHSDQTVQRPPISELPLDVRGKYRKIDYVNRALGSSDSFFIPLNLDIQWQDVGISVTQTSEDPGTDKTIETSRPIHLTFKETAFISDRVYWNHYTVQFGNCDPMCFVVKLYERKDSARAKYMLLGRKELSTSNGWLVALRDTTEEKQSFETYSLFRERLEQFSGENLNLEQFVNIVLELISNTEPMQIASLFGKWETAEKAGALNKTYTDATETYLDTYTNLVDYSVFPPDCAFDILSKEFETKDSVSDEQLSEHPSSNKDSTECAICLEPVDPQNTVMITLKPCLHSFCLTCWRMHAYTLYCNFRNQVTCLHPHCGNTANTSVLLSLLSGPLFQIWRQRIVDSWMNLSFTSSWCPSCGHMVVLKKPTSTGIPVKCQCGETFCHTCLDTPHWPATCQQLRGLAGSAIYQSLNKVATNPTYSVFVRPCKHCGYFAEKDEGCNDVYCCICHYRYDWDEMKDKEEHKVLKSNLSIKYRNDVMFSLLNCAMCLESLNRILATFQNRWCRGTSRHNMDDALRLHDLLEQLEASEVDKNVLQSILEGLDFIKLANTVCNGFHLVISVCKQIDTARNDKRSFVCEIDKQVRKLTSFARSLEARIYTSDLKILKKNESYHARLVSKGRLMIANLMDHARKIDCWPNDEFDYSWIEDADATLMSYVSYRWC